MVTARTGNDVDVKLWYQVPERSDVDLICLEQFVHGCRQVHNLFQNFSAVCPWYLVQFPQIRDLRNQDDPWVACIVHQEQGRRAHLTNAQGVGCELWM